MPNTELQPSRRPIHQLVEEFNRAEIHNYDQALLELKLGLRPHRVRSVLERTTRDPRSFAVEFHLPRGEFLRKLTSAYENLACRDRNASRTRGYVGLLLLTIHLLNEAERARFSDQRSVANRQEISANSGDLPDDLAKRLVADPAVQYRLRWLYGLDDAVSSSSGSADKADPDQYAKARRVWDGIDFSTLEFHKLGTTSFILRCESMALDGRSAEVYALKCLLYPYTQFLPIADATREYEPRFTSAMAAWRSATGSESASSRVAGDKRPEHVAYVWASTSKWILMSFVAGDSLRDVLEAHEPERGHELALLADLAPRLFVALDELHALRLTHHDLSPSNIIVQYDSDEWQRGIRPGSAGSMPSVERLVLVDLGRNHLYTRAIGPFESPEEMYVAPEIKNVEEVTSDDTPEGLRKSDLYSLGHILIALIGCHQREGGVVPDALYEDIPLLGRFIEDLIDEQPANRLLIFRSQSSIDYMRLQRSFLNELEATEAARKAELSDVDEHWLWGRFREMLPAHAWLPSSRSPQRLAALLRVRREQGGDATDDAMYSKYLHRWSLVCATSWYVTITLVVLWLLRDLTLDPIGLGLQALGKWPHLPKCGNDAYPLIDCLNAKDYHIEGNSISDNLKQHLPVRVLGISFALIGTRFYQSLFAGITARVNHEIAAWRRAEIFMRLVTFHWVPLVLICNLYEPRWWPSLVAIGLSADCLLDYACRDFADTALKRARTAETRLSTVPAADRPIPGLREFMHWGPRMRLYCLVCALCALGLQTHLLQDVWVYAGLVTIINVALFYLHKCGELAPMVRGGLTRAFLAAERLHAQHPEEEEMRRVDPCLRAAPVEADSVVTSSSPIPESQERETPLLREEQGASDKQSNRR
jgi:serine/threonine protein kinase